MPIVWHGPYLPTHHGTQTQTPCPHAFSKTHIGHSAAVAVHSLSFQSGLLHTPPERLILILGVQDEQAGVLCGPLEEGHVGVEASAQGGTGDAIGHKGIICIA